MLLSKKKKQKAGAKVKKAIRKKMVKKRVVRKRVKIAKTRKEVVRKAPAIEVPKGEEVLIGRVTHYFPHVKAGAVMIKGGTFALGDTIHIKGHTTDFKQKVKSLQINRVPIQEGSVGDEVGVLVKSRVRINDKVYKVKV